MGIKIKGFVISFLLFTGINCLHAQSKISQDYNSIQPGISYKEMIEKYGKPDFTVDISKVNFFWFDYKASEKETYRFWCGTTENVLMFSVISDNETKEIFYDSRVSIENKDQGNIIYFVPLGTQKLRIIKQFGIGRNTLDKTGNVLLYRISDDESAKLYFSNTQKLWKISKVINGREREWCMDIRLLAQD